MDIKEFLHGVSGWKLRYSAEQIELRKSFDFGDLLLIFSGDGGYTYKSYTPNDPWRSTKGKNIHLSLNGPILITFDEMEEIMTLVERAKKFFKDS